MAEKRDPLAAFAAGTFEGVATERDVGVDTLRRLARDHQLSVRELPGVDDLVYEWRNLFHRDPLLERTPEAYVLTIREPVWAEFGDRLSLSGAELAALQAVHARQARAVVDSGRLDEGAPIVLTRP